MKRKEIAKKFIKGTGISFAKFAKEIGLSPQNWNHHFKKDDIDLDLFQKILNKLIEKGIDLGDVKIGDSFGGTGNYNIIGNKNSDIKTSSENMELERRYLDSIHQIGTLKNTIEQLLKDKEKLKAELAQCKKNKT